MTRNRYTLTPSVQDTKRKAGRTKSNGIRINTQQAESKKTVPFPKNGSTAIHNNNKKNNQDIHAKIYNDWNNEPQQKLRLGTVICFTYIFYMTKILALNYTMVYSIIFPHLTLPPYPPPHTRANCNWSGGILFYVVRPPVFPWHRHFVFCFFFHAYYA